MSDNLTVDDLVNVFDKILQSLKVRIPKLCRDTTTDLESPEFFVALDGLISSLYDDLVLIVVDYKHTDECQTGETNRLVAMTLACMFVIIDYEDSKTKRCISSNEIIQNATRLASLADTYITASDVNTKGYALSVFLAEMAKMSDRPTILQYYNCIMAAPRTKDTICNIISEMCIYFDWLVEYDESIDYYVIKTPADIIAKHALPNPSDFK